MSEAQTNTGTLTLTTADLVTNSGSSTTVDATPPLVLPAVTPIPPAQPAAISNNITNTTTLGNVQVIPSTTGVAVLGTGIASVLPTALPIPIIPAVLPAVIPAPKRLLSVVSSDLEAALVEIEQLSKGVESHFASWFEANAPRLKAEAAAIYNATLNEKKTLVADLEAELTATGNWFSMKIAAVRSLF